MYNNEINWKITVTDYEGKILIRRTFISNSIDIPIKVINCIGEQQKYPCHVVAHNIDYGFYAEKDFA